MNPDFHRDGGGRFSATGAPTAKRLEVWLPPDVLEAVDRHCQQHGVGRGKAIAALLSKEPLGAAALPPPADHQWSGTDPQWLDVKAQREIAEDALSDSTDPQWPDETVIQMTVGTWREAMEQALEAGFSRGVELALD